MLRSIRKSLANYGSFKTIGIYTFSNFFAKAISFASLPLFTYLLSQKDFGVISIFSASIGFLMPLVSLGILYSTSTDYFKLDKPEFTLFISSTFFLPVGMSVILGVIFFLFFPFFEAKAGFNALFIWLLPLVVYCNFLFEQTLILIRNNNQPKLFLYINISKIVLELSLAILLIAVLHYRWEGRVFGISAALFVAAIFSVFYLFRKRYLPGKINFSSIKNELLYSIPAIATQLSVFAISTSDRFFINYYYGEERTGVYSLAATFASVILIFCMALLQFFTPRIYSELSKRSPVSVIKGIFWKYCLAILAGYAALVIFTLIAYYYFISKQFLDGLPWFFLLVTGNTIWCIGYFLYSFLFYHKAKKKILLVSISAIFVSVLVNDFLISRYSEKGAAIATIINCSFILVLILFTTKVYLKKS
ncbi:MAG TPA: oligosaccharide flippase family protein [Chitinophagaceae bacterium]